MFRIESTNCGVIEDNCTDLEHCIKVAKQHEKKCCKDWLVFVREVTDTIYNIVYPLKDNGDVKINGI